MQVPAAAARQKFTASSPKIRSSRPPAREVLHLPTHVYGAWNKDHPKMNSVRDACRGCKTGKPIFLLFRLVESTLEGPPGRIRVSHASVAVSIADSRFQSLNQSNLKSKLCNLNSESKLCNLKSAIRRPAWYPAVRWREILPQTAGCNFPAGSECGRDRMSAGPGRHDAVS